MIDQHCPHGNGFTPLHHVAQLDTSPTPEAAPSGITLLAKVRFYGDALDRHRLDGGCCRVLFVVVFRLLGLRGSPQDRGWAAVATVADQAGLSLSSTREALSKLAALGIVQVSATRGRAGRTYVIVPGLIGAADRITPRPLGRPAAIPRPEKMTGGPVINGQEMTGGPAIQMTGPPVMSPLKDSNRQESPPDQDARGRAGGGGKRGRGFQRFATIEAERRRLLARLQGLAKSRGLDPGIAETILVQQPTKAIEAMLDLQREGDEQAVAARLSDALAAHFGVFRSQQPPRTSRRPVYSPIDIHNRTMERLEAMGLFDDDPPEAPPHGGPTLDGVAEAIDEAAEPSPAPAKLPAPKNDPMPATTAAAPPSPAAPLASPTWRPPVRRMPTSGDGANLEQRKAELQQQIATLWQAPAGSGGVALTR